MSSISIKQTDNEITARILFTLRKDVSKKLEQKSPLIEAQIRDLIRTKVYYSKHIESLLSDEYMSLRSQFGLTEDVALSAVDEILDVVSNSIFTYLIPGKGNLIASLGVTLTPISIETLVNIPHGKYISDRSGSDIRWLEWLLIRGSSVIIADWRMFNKDGEGRVGNTIMVPRGVFRVEGGFDGTPDDNFITQAIRDSYDEIILILRKTLNA